MSWIRVFTTIQFIPMSVSPAGKPELPTLPSAHQHAGLWASQLAQLSRKHFCTMSWVRPLPQHTLHLLVATSLRPCQTRADFVSSKDRAAGTHKRMLELQAVAWGRATADWYLLWKASQGIVVWARDTNLFNFASSFIGLFIWILLLYPYLKGDLYCGAPQLSLIATELQ